MKKSVDPPLEIARAFVADMRACFAELDETKADEIANRQLHALKPYNAGKMGLSDVKAMFLAMRQRKT